MRVVLKESTERRLPFVADLLASLADEVIVAHAPPGPASFENVSLVVVACGEWSGAETTLCRETSSERTGVPLLAISGPTPPALRTAALRAGADEFLCVPFEVDELAARMFALVRLSTRGAAHRAGVFVVDAVRRRILVHGKGLALTLREYDVLAALVVSEGAVVTRSTLMSHFGGAGAAGSNSVDVLVSRIRTKLGPLARSIETVRGEGYRLRSRSGREGP